LNTNVAIVINCLEKGGAQKIASILFEHLNNLSDNTRLIVIDKDISGFYLPRDHWNGKIVILGKTRSDSLTLFKILSFPVSAITFFRILKKLKIKVIISFMERANILTLLTSSKYKRIISIRNYAPFFFEKKSILKRIFIKISYKTLLKRADIINFNSIESALAFQKLFNIRNDKVSIIFNLCDVEAIRKASAISVFDNVSSAPENYLVTVGRLVLNKCHSRLIRAFSVLAGRYPHMNLVIVGGGPLYHKLVQLTSDLGLKGRVFFVGPKDNPFPYVKRSKFFILSSRNEGFPNVLLEAMALGLPVISTDCSSGPRELLYPESDPLVKTSTLQLAPYGILVPSFIRGFLSSNIPITQKELVLAQAMKLLLDDESLYHKYASASKARILDFLPEKILPQWFELLGFKNKRAYGKGL